MRGFFICTVIGFIAGCICMAFVIFGANGAPQEAAGSSMALAFIVLPYCMLSALQRARLIELEETNQLFEGREGEG